MDVDLNPNGLKASSTGFDNKQSQSFSSSRDAVGLHPFFDDEYSDQSMGALSVSTRRRKTAMKNTVFELQKKIHDVDGTSLYEI